jgi:integrase
MATVYSRPLKSGGVRWYTKVDGKPVPLKSARTEPQARKLAYELEANNERLKLGLQGGTMFDGTFGELCKWAWDVHFKNLRSNQSDRSRLEYHGGAAIVDRAEKKRRGKKQGSDGYQSWLGKKPARQVTSHVLETYFDELAQRLTVRGTPTSPGAINRVRAVFSKVFALAKSRGKWAGDNPAELTDERKSNRTESSILSLDEIPRVLAALDDYWRGCFAVALLAGLRKGEVFGLRKADVDIEGRRLLVRHSHGNDRTKGSDDGRPEPVPIHDSLMPFVVEAMQSPGPYLFPNRDGKRRHEKTHVELILRAAMVRAGIVERYDHKCRRKGCGHVESHADDEPRRCPKADPARAEGTCDMKLLAIGVARDITFHATRHTLASQALMAGASIAAVQKILRHKDPRLTIKTYGHLAPDFLGEELNRMTIPGLASTSERRPSPDTAGEWGEPSTPPGIPSRRFASGVGAHVVHADRLSVIGPVPGFGSGLKHAGLSVEPTGIEPVTYALRTHRSPS